MRPVTGSDVRAIFGWAALCCLAAGPALGASGVLFQQRVLAGPHELLTTGTLTAARNFGPGATAVTFASGKGEASARGALARVEVVNDGVCRKALGVPPWLQLRT